MSSLLAYTVLIGLLVVSNWAQCIRIISWVSSLVSYWLTTPTILTLYGLVLLYLLFAVHTLAVAKESSTKRRKSTLAPYYDEDGKLQGWVREEGREVENVNPNRPPALARRDSLPLPPPPVTPSLLKGPSMLSQIDPDSRLTSWDGFPNHRFRCQFTRQQVEDTSRLAVYWVGDKRPGKRGSLDAVTPEKGRLSRFRCAGIIQCKAAVCTVTSSLTSDDSDSQISSGKEITQGNVEDDQGSNDDHNEEDEGGLQRGKLADIIGVVS
ncbi:hypothetical protein C8R46DRAFT_1228819 [Mycena filopes]|nr:hypothetical protein C8R46DRAFT_1228819 [Mycena filopes]